MEEVLLNIDKYLNFLPFNGYLIIFLLAFIEAIAFVGIIFPGTILLVLIGSLAALGVFSLPVAIFLAIVGALTGDIVSYYMGKKKGVDLKIGQKSVFRWLYVPEAGEFLLDKGGFSIIVGRFIGPTRAFVPFFMGAAGEKERQFILYDIIGVVIWSVFYLGLGFLFGESYSFIGNFMGGITFFVVLLIILTIGPLIATKLFKKKIKKGNQ